MISELTSFAGNLLEHKHAAAAEPQTRFLRFWHSIFDWECWPKTLFFLPLVPLWAWYCLRSRSLWFFTATNPSLTFGGYEGEGKREMYERLPPGAYPKTHWFLPSQTIESVLDCLSQAGFFYPFYAKPEVGMSGILCRKITNETEMRHYHQNSPVEYMAQSEADFPLELGVFYIRYPGEQHGVITGLTQKELPQVLGDGHSTVEQLMAKHPYRKYWPPILYKKNTFQQKIVPSKGAVVFLSQAANRMGGCRLINLEHLIDERLTAVFDALSLHAKDFYYGRFDVKCASVEALRSGSDFSIIEFNGVGANAHHIYHCGLSVFEAWRITAKHWKAIYEIGRENRNLGVKTWPLIAGARFLQQSKRHFKLLRKHEI